MQCRGKYPRSHSYWGLIHSSVGSMLEVIMKMNIGRFQDCFIDDQALKDFVAPFLCLNDPYEVCKEDVLRSKWIEENKILHGQFKPAQMDRSMERVTKQ